MKWKKKGAVFAVAIAVMLLMATTMVLSSTEPNAEKLKLTPSESMTFSVRAIPNELIYDDGTAEGAYTWTSAGTGYAVRFTPPSYPVDLDTARICLWPDWPDGDHEEFAIEVYDDDGPGGEPGTLLGAPVLYTAPNWGWNDIDISGLGITITTGDFYILYKQLTDHPDCEAMCTDYGPPLYGRSWDYTGVWSLWPDENYMIRCVVDLPDGENEWTFMVYLDGDNNLEGAAIDDFMEMSSVCSTADMNIVVQFDRIPGYDNSYGDWTDCKRFLVTPGMTPTAANAIADIGECNMGDPNTLSAFVQWAMAEYPENNYALILWNHGSGWKKWVPWKDETGIARGICYDDTNGDYLSLQETEGALTGKYVELLGYDACLMHMIEVAYQVRACAGIDVGSQETEPWDGWPYDTILSDLAGTPTMTPSAFATTIVTRYIASYTFCDVTQSAVDKTEVSNLASAVDNLAQVLINKLDDPECNYYEIQQARNEVEDFYYPDYIDLYHFAELIQSCVPGTSTVANAVMNNVDTTVIAEAHGSCHPNAHGLSIYFPKEESDYLLSYGSTAFASDTQWNEFLEKYYEGPEDCCAETALYKARVPNPEDVLNPLRELRDKYLKKEYVDRYYDYSPELSMVMTRDLTLAYKGARLLVKYSPMVQRHLYGIKGTQLITGRDVEEVVSFIDKLKSGVMKNSGEIDSMRSQGAIKFMDEFKGQVEASEGKTFSEALQDSIYYKGKIPKPGAHQHHGRQ